MSPRRPVATQAGTCAPGPDAAPRPNPRRPPTAVRHQRQQRPRRPGARGDPPPTHGRQAARRSPGGRLLPWPIPASRLRASSRRSPRPADGRSPVRAGRTPAPRRASASNALYVLVLDVPNLQLARTAPRDAALRSPPRCTAARASALRPSLLCHAQQAQQIRMGAEAAVAHSDPELGAKPGCHQRVVHPLGTVKAATDSDVGSTTPGPNPSTWIPCTTGPAGSVTCNCGRERTPRAG